MYKGPEGTRVNEMSEAGHRCALNKDGSETDNSEARWKQNGQALVGQGVSVDLPGDPPWWGTGPWSQPGQALGGEGRRGAKEMF